MNTLDFAYIVLGCLGLFGIVSILIHNRKIKHLKH
ncbi:MAG: hypothetical protein MAG551_02606 [Candidatus Scalindua arabica]|uniref:Uncharacterized protein n=1 Tax=Candidatus Scalindua arabica TaxID=1127984 RepID=A0A941W4T7_9BACT|nr:hypothetical protein [Candidatus Scalindua arabica]